MFSRNTLIAPCNTFSSEKNFFFLTKDASRKWKLAFTALWTGMYLLSDPQMSSLFQPETIFFLGTSSDKAIPGTQLKLWEFSDSAGFCVGHIMSSLLHFARAIGEVILALGYDHSDWNLLTNMRF